MQATLSIYLKFLSEFLFSRLTGESMAPDILFLDLWYGSPVFETNLIILAYVLHVFALIYLTITVLTSDINLVFSLIWN